MLFRSPLQLKCQTRRQFRPGRFVLVIRRGQQQARLEVGEPGRHDQVVGGDFQPQGMRPLDEAAQLERSVSIFAISILSLLVLSAIFIHTKWAALLALPAVFMPFLFLADMYFWMRNFGQNLDPTAALSSTIEPFTPPVLGEGLIGQFRTIASPDSEIGRAHV